jgi:hypothetical protein
VIARGLRGLWASSTLEARIVHAPVALVPGRIALRVVAKGTGILVVGSKRRLVAGGLDDLVFVDVAAGASAVVVRFRGHVVVVPFVPVAAPAPVVLGIVLPVVPVAVPAIPTAAVDVPVFFLPLPDLEESR